MLAGCAAPGGVAHRILEHVHGCWVPGRCRAARLPERACKALPLSGVRPWRLRASRRGAKKQKIGGCQQAARPL